MSSEAFESGSGFAHQDWKQVIIRNPKAAAAAAPKKILQKDKAPHLQASVASSTGKLARTIEKNEEEGKPLPRVDTQERTRFIQLRTRLKLKQEDVARLVNVNAADIKAIEAGTAIRNGPLMAKLFRILEKREQSLASSSPI